MLQNMIWLVLMRILDQGWNVIFAFSKMRIVQAYNCALSLTNFYRRTAGQLS